MNSASYRIGVDVGGTFTDVVLVGDDCSVKVSKSLSNPLDPSDGVISALKRTAAEMGMTLVELLSRCGLFVHGSTIATNALLERKGCKVGLLTTEGFRDSLEIRRGIRVDVWDHRAPPPTPLVPRSLRQPILERTSADGAVLRAVDEVTVHNAADVFENAGVEAVAICLINGFANGENERAVHDILHERSPYLQISCSSDVAAVMGEYERTSTTVVNSYISRKVLPYLSALRSALGSSGLKGSFLMAKSNGGVATLEELASTPVHLILSGPAAGSSALRSFAHKVQASNLVSIEVGGTSCDVMVVSGGELSMTERLEVDQHVLMIPSVEVHTVGAGGGTIARVNADRRFTVGPHGAGSRPGPACYERGGTEATVTDAHLVLGRLKAGASLESKLSLNMEKAVSAIAGGVAEPLGVNLQTAAAGIIRLVEQEMWHAVEQVILGRGHDPRSFALVAAGGAGPLHGVNVARLLGCQKVYIPAMAGVFCALGMCSTNVRHDKRKSFVSKIGEAGAMGRLEEQLAEMKSAAQAVLLREGFDIKDHEHLTSIECRYVGQQWCIDVGFEAIDAIDIRKRFEAAHRYLYGYAQENGTIETLSLQLASIGKLPILAEPPLPKATTKAEPQEWRVAWIDSERGALNVPVYNARVLEYGHRIKGPALIDAATTTVLLGYQDELHVLSDGSYCIDVFVS
ncbi:hydantoinase/oxoprolinase family protein [Mesorhizobium sp. L2C084A000]|uniref:hydantoinase/oxoprolinase family protein n=1 Tax=Mesorhizobium sp. L2C084A000 TaxID=1287116 RepID=UPI0003CFD268|nr:hydantoinase/oxoprolinase family protein [Mesorhizobium sp. L2C084A000]ESZ23990.1 5-oxoprolinase [Mesorhizobium sp. L2C084A000]